MLPSKPSCTINTKPAKPHRLLTADDIMEQKREAQELKIKKAAEKEARKKKKEAAKLAKELIEIILHQKQPS